MKTIQELCAKIQGAYTLQGNETGLLQVLWPILARWKREIYLFV